MADKNYTEIIIDGKRYRMSGDQDEAYLQEVAGYLDSKIAEMRTLDGYRRLSAEMQAVLLELNLADDYFRAKRRVEELESHIDSMEQEIYNLKHELVTGQIRREKERNGKH